MVDFKEDERLNTLNHSCAQRVGTDSVVTEKKADSIQSVDIRKNVPARMNPREMKENNAADHSHSDRPQRIKRRN